MERPHRLVGLGALLLATSTPLCSAFVGAFAPTDPPESTPSKLERLERQLNDTEEEMARLQQQLRALAPPALRAQCASSDTCPTGQKCVEGFCKCPVLSTGPDCKEHIAIADEQKAKCAMGMHHPRFDAEYGGKYRAMGGVSDLEMTSHVRIKQPGTDLPDRLQGSEARSHVRALVGLATLLWGVLSAAVILDDFYLLHVIGGSGNVLAHNFGPEINAHTAVIRFNDAPVTTYEAWVGNKTSLRIQNLDFCGFSPSKDQLCYAYTSADRPCLWRQWSKPGKGRKAAAGNCIPLTPSHRNSKYIFWYWRMNSLSWVKDPACNPKCGAKTSAGYFGILLAMNLCGKVDVYGFGSNSAKEQPHYYTKTLSWARKDWQLRHHWSFERECLNELASGLVPGVTVHR